MKENTNIKDTLWCLLILGHFCFLESIYFVFALNNIIDNLKANYVVVIADLTRVSRSTKEVERFYNTHPIFLQIM